MTQESMTLALAGLSFMLTAIWGPPLLRVLRHYKVGKAIRVEGPQRHITKMGTPTMGGVLFVVPVLLLTTLLNAAPLVGLSGLGRSVLLPMGVLVLYAALGAVDDWQGLHGEGMRARTKFTMQVVFALLAAIGLYYVLDVPHMFVPGVKGEVEISAILYLPIAVFLIVSFSNAVNLTDGLDGLAGLISATAYTIYGAIALVQGQVFLARFCFILVGAVFGFLWFNVHPAELIMGDTGSLSLGATLAVVALMTGQWLILPVIAIIPVSTTLSVMIQTTYFRYTRRKYGEGRRLFKMAPLHHHFELLGWSETQVVQRF
ncbi:MAG: phospho-N-acetylmuramoyl-pentapeptide-transferase, partial [Anaerolineales bacterium]